MADNSCTKCPLCQAPFSDPLQSFYYESSIENLAVGKHLLKDHKRTGSQAQDLLNRQANGKSGITASFLKSAVIVDSAMFDDSMLLLTVPDDFDWEAFEQWWNDALMGKPPCFALLTNIGRASDQQLDKRAEPH